MKSDVCAITRDESSIASILNEAEKAASYSKLDKKQTMRLRLLAEELVGMLPELLTFSSGEFWIESDNSTFELHTLLSPDEAMNSANREKILSVSKSGKNLAARGIMNKIKLAAQFMMIDYNDAVSTTGMEYEFFSMGMGDPQIMKSAYAWSLQKYRVKSEEKKDEAWDELEKSIIANIADDVLVSLNGKSVEIIVKKTF
ncbi:hypothetical protein [uncultured Treponema sp.]|uniref:hypothetical protein n=1 Tax=uncultured Treponema sp. TaxID=162155 RepID=UPI0025EAD2FA|nr:hypothetical protein [uncultured Treponema sp.]